MFDKLRSRPKRKPPEDIPLWSPQEKIIQPALEQWPQVRDQTVAVLKAGRDKFAEAYVTVAEIVTEKKEAWQDRRAEKKAAERKSESPSNETKD